MESTQLNSFGTRMRSLRLAKGISQVELSKMIGRHQTAIGPYERDEYAPAKEVIEKLASILDVSPEYLMFGRSARRSLIKVKGKVGAGGLVRAPEIRGSMQHLKIKDEQLLGYEIIDDTMAPAFQPEWVLLVAELPVTTISEVINCVALVTLDDERQILRKILPAREADRFDLFAYNAPTIRSVIVENARPALGSLHRSAISS